MDSEKKERTPEEMRQFIDQLTPNVPEPPVPEMTEEEYGRLVARFDAALVESRAKIAAVRAKGGSDAQMEEA